MKRIISLLLLSVLCTSLVACSSNEESTDDATETNGNISVSGGSTTDVEPVEAERSYQIQLVSIDGTSVNIRLGPGTSYDKVTQASTGEYFELTEAGDEWNQIVYNGTEAYVSSAYSSVIAVDYSDLDSYIDGTIDTSDDDATDESTDETDEDISEDIGSEA